MAVVLLLINIYLLIQGCFIDTTSGEILITPILFPIAQMFGINTLQFGIIICYNLILGALTPPHGCRPLSCFLRDGYKGRKADSTFAPLLCGTYCYADVNYLYTGNYDMATDIHCEPQVKRRKI